MSDPFLYTFESPLAGYENLPTLPEELNEDGKSYKNPETGVLSESYQKFTSGVTNGTRGGFDIHIYYHYNNPEQREYAKALWERIRREFPELRQGFSTILLACVADPYAEYTNSGINRSALI
jgi:DOPA 4,5-dioxygenase